MHLSSGRASCSMMLKAAVSSIDKHQAAQCCGRLSGNQSRVPQIAAPVEAFGAHAVIVTSIFVVTCQQRIASKA